MADDNTYAIWEGDADPICPVCGSGNLTTILGGGPPVKCEHCGWRGWMPVDPEEGM